LKEMNRKLRVTFGLVALLTLLLTISCVGKITGDVTRFPDPEFNGEWIDDGITITIGSDEGLLFAVGFNNNLGAAWDRLSFSGRVLGEPVQNANLASVDVQIWATGSQGNPTEFSLELRRNGNTILLNLEPLNESYLLQKQQ
jgi:hypothetical protein